MTKGRIVGRLHQAGCGRVSAGAVTDQMQMLAGRGGDAERLFHQAVRLISTTVRTVVRHVHVRVAPSGAVRRPAGPGPGSGGGGGHGGGGASSTFHLTVGQEAPGDPAGAPGLAVGPTSHTSLSFVPDEDGTGPDRPSFLLRQSPLNSRQQAQPTGLEKYNGISRSPDLTVISLHDDVGDGLADGGDGCAT